MSAAYAVRSCVTCLLILAMQAYGQVNTRPKAAPARGLALSPTWRMSMARGKLKLADTFLVIGKHGNQRVDTAMKAISLSQDISYLMPLNDAMKLLKKTASSKKPVACPGFPVDCFRAYSFDGRFLGNGSLSQAQDRAAQDVFNKLLIITDTADQVVGLQYVDEAPKSTRLSMHTDEFHLYNFIETMAKASTTWRIQHVVARGADQLTVRSEVVDNSGKPREYVLLILAAPIVDVVSLSSDPEALKEHVASEAPNARWATAVPPQIAATMGRDSKSRESPKTDAELRLFLKGSRWEFDSHKIVTLRDDGTVHKSWGVLTPAWEVERMRLHWEGKAFEFSEDFSVITEIDKSEFRGPGRRLDN